MCWISTKGSVDYRSKDFTDFFYHFVILCPAFHRIYNSKTKVVAFKNVSVRDCSFRDRGIEKGLVLTILSQIRKITPDTFFMLTENGSVEEKVEEIEKSRGDCELMVFKQQDRMSDTCSIYYYIRNAFAHGSFEIRQSGRREMYLLESAKDMNVKCRIRLSKQNLKKIMLYALMTPQEILNLRKERYV